MPKKGYKQTDEHKRKCTILRIGLRISKATRLKISIKQKGIPRSYMVELNRNRIWSKESRDKISKTLTQDRLCNYKRRARRVYKEFYGAISKCEICKSNNRVCIHHKDRNKFNNNIKNLKALCASCHAKEHLKERINAQKEKTQWNKRNAKSSMAFEKDY